MSQKKTNIEGSKKPKIQASTVLQGPTSDPISTPIIKEEKEPNQNIDSNWVPFFRDSSNIYVNDLAKRGRRSSTNSAIINQKIAFAIGQEFIYFVDGEEVLWDELDEGFKEWSQEVNAEGQSLRDVYKELQQDWIITGNAYPQVVKSGDFTAIYSVDATKVRKSKDKKTAYISSFWRDILLTSTPTAQYPINTVPFFNMSGTQKEYIKHIRRKYPEFDYYGLPDYVGALNWIDIEYRVAKYNIDKFDNGFMPSILLQQFGEVPNGMTAQQYVEEIKKKFVGEGNNDKFLVELLDSPEQAAKVTEFERERDGEFQMLSKLAVDNIVTAHRITPQLAGLETSGKLGGSNELRIQYEKFMNSVVGPSYQEPVLKCLNGIIRNETTYSNVSIGVRNLEPVGLSHEVDINAVLSVNEGRAILGFDTLEDKGEVFINNNSVENIETTGEETPEQE